jgi:hypothetical protein
LLKPLVVALVLIWSLVAMAFAQIVQLRSSRLLELAYYAIAGIG